MTANIHSFGNENLTDMPQILLTIDDGIRLAYKSYLRLVNKKQFIDFKTYKNLCRGYLDSYDQFRNSQLIIKRKKQNLCEVTKNNL